jgi:pilus assembly protein CpaE
VLDCVLISSDEEFRRLVHELLRDPDTRGHLVLDIPRSAHEVPRDALGKILTANPRVVFVDLADATTGVRVIRTLSQEAPDVAYVVAGPQLSAEALLSVMRAGANEYLPRPLSREDASEAMARVRRRYAPLAAEGSSKPGRLSTVFSAKGGTGVTTIAANLAVALSEITGEQTLLVDIAPSLGTAALILGLQPRYSYLDVVQNFHRIDEELLRSFLQTHHCGLSVLASPPISDEPGGLSEHETLGLLRLCRRYFRFVVVDGGHGIGDALNTSLAESDDRIVVTTPELPTLRNLKRAMEMLYVQSANGSEGPRVLLNQFRDDAGVVAKDVETALGYAVTTVIEREDPAVAHSINVGEPMVLMGKSKFGRQIRELGADIAGPDYVVGREGGILGSLLKPFQGSRRAAKETD